MVTCLLVLDCDGRKRVDVEWRLHRLYCYTALGIAPHQTALRPSAQALHSGRVFRHIHTVCQDAWARYETSVDYVHGCINYHTTSATPYILARGRHFA